MTEYLDYLILVNVLSILVILLSRQSKLPGIYAAVVWTISWLLIQNSAGLPIELFTGESTAQSLLGTALVLALAVLFIYKPRLGLIGLVLALPFRIPLEIAGTVMDVRKMFILFVVATYLGLKLKGNNKSTIMDAIIALIFLLISTSYFWAVNSHDAIIRYSFFYAPFCLLYKVVTLINFRKHTRILVTVSLVSAFFIASYGLATSIKPMPSDFLPLVAPNWKTSETKGKGHFFMTENGKKNYIQNIKLIDREADVRLFQDLKVAKKTRRMQATVRLSSSNIDNLYVTVNFFQKSLKENGKKKKLSAKHVYKNKGGSGGWQNITKNLKVPKGANFARVSIRAKSLKPGGALAVDKVSLSPSKLKNAEFNSGGYITKYIKKIRSTSIFWDPNVFAKYLVFVLLLGAITLSEAKRFGVAKTLLLSTPAVLVSFAALFLTVSRSGFLSLLLGLFIILFSFILVSYKKIYGMAALSAIILLSLFVIINPPDFAERLSVFGAKPDLEELMIVSGGRNYLMEAGIKMIKDKPALGFGLGSFSDVYHLYKGPGARKDLTESHNSFITIAAEQGLAGLVLIVWLVVMATYLFFRKIFRRQYDAALVASFAILCAFLLNSTVYAYFFEDPYTWFALGIFSSSLTVKNGR